MCACAHLLQAAPTRLLDELLWVHLLPNVVTHVECCLLEKLGKEQQDVSSQVSSGQGAAPSSPAAPTQCPELGSGSQSSEGLGLCPAQLTFMYLLKTPRISSLMLGCSTARNKSMDTTGSVKLWEQMGSQARCGHRPGGPTPLPAGPARLHPCAACSRGPNPPVPGGHLGAPAAPLHLPMLDHDVPGALRDTAVSPEPAARPPPRAAASRPPHRAARLLLAAARALLARRPRLLLRVTGGAHRAALPARGAASGSAGLTTSSERDPRRSPEVAAASGTGCGPERLPAGVSGGAIPARFLPCLAGRHRRRFLQASPSPRAPRGRALCAARSQLGGALTSHCFPFWKYRNRGSSPRAPTRSVAEAQ